MQAYLRGNWVWFQTTTKKRLSQQSKSSEYFDFSVHIKAVFTLYCSLLSALISIMSEKTMCTSLLKNTLLWESQIVTYMKWVNAVGKMVLTELPRLPQTFNFSKNKKIKKTARSEKHNTVRYACNYNSPSTCCHINMPFLSVRP